MLQHRLIRQTQLRAADDLGAVQRDEVPPPAAGRAVGCSTRCARDLHARGQHEPSDLNDLAALSIAVAYCDIVVTEKQWVHVLTKSKADKQMNTTLLSDVAKLPEAIV